MKLFLYFIFIVLTYGVDEQLILKTLEKYYVQYKVMLMDDLTKATTNKEHWEKGDKHILTLPMDKQAEYADYIFKQLVKNHNLDWIRFVLKYIMRDYQRIEKTSDVIGNVALLVKTILENSNDPIEKKEIQRLYDKIIKNF